MYSRGSSVVSSRLSESRSTEGNGILSQRFAFSTLISWSYYGEQGVTYVFGEKGIKPYRYIFVIFVFLGAIAKLSVVLNISDGVYGLLAIPNMIACFLLMPVVKQTLKEYKHKLSTGVIKRID